MRDLSAIRIVTTCFLICIFLSFSVTKKSEAMSCAYSKPSIMDFVTAPVVFSGKVIKIFDEMSDDGKKQRYTRFQVHHVFKGDKMNDVDVETYYGDFGVHLPLGNEYMIMPEISQEGKLSLSYCNKSIRHKNYWNAKLRHIHKSPFLLYILTLGYIHYMLIAFVVFLVSICCFFTFKRKKADGCTR